jgi:hypothetical protein
MGLLFGHRFKTDEFPVQKIDWIILAICLGLLLPVPGVGEPVFLKVEQWFACLARSKKIALAAIGGFTILARMALLPWMPVPQAEACATVPVALFS